MPTTFTNTYKNILDKLQSVLRSEFSNTLPVYVGEANKKAGNQYLRLDPIGSNLIEYNSLSETREYSINIFLYIANKSTSRKKLNAVLRLVSRIESLIVDNVNMTFTNEEATTERLHNCRIDTTQLDADVDNTENYVVLFEFKTLHIGNFS